MLAEPAVQVASSSRSQLAMRTARAAVSVAWEGTSMEIYWRPSLTATIVSHLVTRSLVTRLVLDVCEERVIQVGPSALRNLSFSYIGRWVVERSPGVSTGSTSQNNDFADDQATAERAAAAIQIVTAALDAVIEAEPLTVTSNATPRVIPLAYGWFASIVRTGQLVALAHDHGLRHECAASARAVLQHALALQWLIERGDPAVDAVEADGQRRAFDLVKELADTGWPIPAELTMRPSTRPTQSGALEHQFGNFKAMKLIQKTV